MKNPWLSAWLTGANAWSGAARGVWAGEIKRQQSAAAREMTRQAADFWASSPVPPAAAPAPKRPRTARKRRRAG